MGKSILDNMTFSFPKSAKMIMLVGPNGAGKTTLLKILAGLLEPSKGRIDRPLQRIGYMPGGVDLASRMPLSVKDFLDFTHDAKVSTVDILAQFSLPRSFLQAPLEALSLGERQKILWMRTLMRDPDILLLDEPFSNVDVQTESFLYGQLEKLLKKNKCVVMASHDLHMVFERSDFILFLDRHLCCAGKPHLVKENKDYERLFGETSLRPFRHRH